MKSIFLIDRGKQSLEYQTSTAFRQVVLADSSRVARRLAGDTAAGASAWQNFGTHNKGNGLLLVRWRGMDVDYGTNFRPSVLPDGTTAGFHHRDNRATWGLIHGAAWWSNDPGSCPKWLRKLGALTWDELGPPVPSENVFLQAIRQDEALAGAKDTGNRPFGFRACKDWLALAESPKERVPFLPGMEVAGIP